MNIYIKFYLLMFFTNLTLIVLLTASVYEYLLPDFICSV